jgi:hypothetical protein
LRESEFVIWLIIRDQSLTKCPLICLDPSFLQFHAISADIREFSQIKTINIFANLESLAVSVTSHAHDQNQSWPFVHIPDFQVRGMLSNAHTGAHTLSLNPFVYPNQVDAWGRFSVYKSDWMEEAHVYDKAVHEDIYVMPYHETTDAHHDPASRWNVTGITPYIWYAPGGRGATNYSERHPARESVLYSPIWQQAPPCDYQPQINFDLRSDPTFERFIDGMLVTEHAVITQVVDATQLDTNYDSKFDPSEQKEPHSFIMEPVYDKLTKDRTMVAFLSAFTRWGTFFTDVLPAHEQGIYVVLENDCGQIFTYEILGHEAVYVGEGDVRDRRVDEGGKLYDKFEFTPFAALEQEGEHRFCHYYAYIYPSEEWKSKFYTNQPIVYALAVVACFVMTTFFFLIYDFLVQRRQDMVMASAQKTNAIVASLFPENVRDRLLQDINNDDKKGKDDQESKRGSWADPSNAFAATGKRRRDEITSEHIFGSKPIADLFPSTTIMFADMVGFTA